MCQFNTSFLSVWQHSHHRYYILDTVQDNLLVRVIFGEFVCKKQLADLILTNFLKNHQSPILIPRQ